MVSRSTLATPQAVDNPSAPIASQNVPAIAPPSSGPPAFADMIQLLLLRQLQQQQQFANMPLRYPSPRPHPSGSHAAYIPSPHARTFIASGPLSPTKVPRISLEQFCDHYGILDENKVHLMKLGYIPGNRNIKTLDRADWKDDAGFPTLTWQSILETHDRFLADIKDGVWDN